jgi:peptide/nickel transport system permease protein
MLGFVRRNPLVVVGGAILLAVVLASVCAPLLTASDPIRPSFSQRLKAPWGLGGTSARPLGADNLGRDIYARVLYGGRISLVLATSAVALATAVGVLVGLLAGYLGGRLDDLVMRIADVQLTFPVIMLAIAIVAVVGTSRVALVSVLALSGWVLHARTVRANVLTLRQLEYVEAARALGSSHGRVVFRHILPNTLAPILVIVSSQFATSRPILPGAACSPRGGITCRTRGGSRPSPASRSRWWSWARTSWATASAISWIRTSVPEGGRR